jgi:pantothenate kinase
MRNTALLKNSDPRKRIVIGLAGVPGSGKTTLARNVVARGNTISSQSPENSIAYTPIAVDMAMDGFHHTRAYLAAMSNSSEAIHRRGAAFTFDDQGFPNLIRSLTSETTETIYAPSFDHSIKDPVEKAIIIPPDSRVVLIEGNYCALDKGSWKEAAMLMNELWYLDTPADIAHKRLARRHLASGIVADEAEAWDRATGTDELNAEEIQSNLLDVHERIVLD